MSREDRRYGALAAFGFAGIVLCFALTERGSWWFLAALVPAATRSGPLLVPAMSAGLALLVAVLVLRHVVAIKRHLHRLDTLRPR